MWNNFLSMEYVYIAAYHHFIKPLSEAIALSDGFAK